VAKRNVHGDLEGRISGKRHNHSNRCQHIEGDFPFGGWDGPNNDFGDPIKTYFDWKRIRYPEYYFNEEFGKLVNPNSDFHFREAKRLGIEPQDLAKVIVTVAHFVERASTNYPSNEAVRAKAARTDEPSVEGTVFHAVPFGEIFAVYWDRTPTILNISSCWKVHQQLLERLANEPRTENTAYRTLTLRHTQDF